MRKAQPKNSNQMISQLATNSLINAVVQEKVKGMRVIALEELKVSGGENSTKITLQLTNTGIIDYTMVFGTPVGIATEYTAIPYSSTLTNIMFTGLGDLADQQGASIPFLQQLNKRFVRNQVFISHMEVIAPDTALGNSQKSESTTRFVVPYNSVTDSASASGSFTPQYTQYTAVNLLDTGIILGEFSGLSYKLLAGSTIKINLFIKAINTPTFTVFGGNITR
jgi:hypothetical protein